MCHLKQKKKVRLKKKLNLLSHKIKEKKKPGMETHPKRCEHRPRISTLQLQSYHKLPVRLSANCPNCSKVTAAGRVYSNAAKETKL